MISADNLALAIKSHSIEWLFFILVCSVLAGCGGSTEPVQLQGQAMGTTWHVTYLPESSNLSSAAAQGEMASLLERVEASMSTYRAESEISRFNRGLVGDWVQVSADFFRVLQAAIAVGEVSRGAYDVTVGPLVRRWGFGPGPQPQTLPSALEIKILQKMTGQHYLRLEAVPGRIMKTADVELDLSSVAKGYAVDLLAEYLASQGVNNYLVEVGGELRLAGNSPRGDAWRVAVEQPDGMDSGVAAALSLTDTAVATSGDYRNFFEREGRRYSHTIDPRTGFPVDHALVSVTVVHSSAMLADAWATSLSVLGPDEGMEVAQQAGLAVYFISRQANGFVASHTPGFAPLLGAAN
jgi:thiamine biosynthesis lipoprotein